MTEGAGPTNADLLAAIQALAVKVDGIDNKTDDLIEATQAGFAHVINELSAVKADVGDVKGDVAVVKGDVAEIKVAVAEIKVELGLLEARVDDAHRAILRHSNDPAAHGNAA